MRSGVYKIEHSLSGKCYIGSSQDVYKRFREHKRMLYKGKHVNIKLQRAWDKYGDSAFSFSVLFLCSKEQLIIKEQEMLDHYRPWRLRGYNICKEAGSKKGIPQTDKQKNAARQNMIKMGKDPLFLEKKREGMLRAIETRRGMRYKKRVDAGTRKPKTVATWNKKRLGSYKLDKGRTLPTGVSKRGNRFRATISRNNKTVFVGSYGTVEQAKNAYIQKLISFMAEDIKNRVA